MLTERKNWDMGQSEKQNSETENSKFNPFMCLKSKFSFSNLSLRGKSEAYSLYCFVIFIYTILKKNTLAHINFLYKYKYKYTSCEFLQLKVYVYKATSNHIQHRFIIRSFCIYIYIYWPVTSVTIFIFCTLTLESCNLTLKFFHFT